MPEQSSTQSSRQIGVLAYHKIGTPPETNFSYIPEAIFEAQLAQIAGSGWQVISPDAFLDGLAHPETLPERALLLTFDDAYRSMYAAALPILRSFGYPCALFVPTMFIGGTNAFDHGLQPEEPLCTWDELLDLQRHGVSLQSHSVSHRVFSKLKPGDILEEVQRSKDALESRTGLPVAMFAYPYGEAGLDPDATGAALCQAGYQAAFLVQGFSHRPPPAQPFAVGRLLMEPDTNLRLGN